MADKKKPPAPPTLAQLIRLPLVLEIPGADGVERRADVIYRRVGGEELKMDVYAPPDLQPGGKRPAVIFIHGGPTPNTLPLPPKDWGVFIGYGRYAAASGFVGITFNHRFFAIDRAADAAGDIAALIAHVRENAGALGIDGQRLALWAFSGGGPFLADFLRHPPAHIRALVFFYALLELRPMIAKKGRAGADDPAAGLSPVSVLEKATGNLPPVFIGRAGLDNPGLNAAIDRFVGLALKKNMLLTLENHPAGCHGFDIRNDDDRSREIIRQAFDFLRTRL